METLEINHFAVFTAAIANMVVGAIWYSPLLFFDAWKKEAGVTEQALESANTKRIYLLSFLLAVLIAYNLAAFLGDAGTTASWGATAGFLAGFGFSAAVFCAIGLFELRSAKYMLINSGYIVACFTLMGLIIGAWR